ncbi:MAG: hypothetical protein GWN30_17590, partial [Gammaproteobacteria bacterium]|nr:hypothetical protein [Gammaproteobacteria bacterium]
MGKRKPGNKYPLIIYQKKWGMLWKLTLALGAAFGFAWWHASVGRIPQILPPRDRWLFLGAAVCLAFSIFAFFAERLNYVQPYPTYFKIVTPLLRLKISYQRIQSVRPVNLNQIYPPKDAKSSIVSVLEPYYGLTSAGIEMTGYPLDEKILRIFLP